MTRTYKEQLIKIVAKKFIQHGVTFTSVDIAEAINTDYPDLETPILPKDVTTYLTPIFDYIVSNLNKEYKIEQTRVAGKFATLYRPIKSELLFGDKPAYIKPTPPDPIARCSNMLNVPLGVLKEKSSYALEDLREVYNNAGHVVEKSEETSQEFIIQAGVSLHFHINFTEEGIHVSFNVEKDQ
jgi:hypothetical protein